jgi:GNAT superfamily N-acetyltransferase
VQIRVAEPDDLALVLEAFGPPYRDLFRRRFPLQSADLGQILIAHRHERPVGTVFISWDEADEPEVRKYLPAVPMIFSLYVTPADRHQGFGRILLRQAEERLRKRGYEQVLVGVDRSNEMARKLYLWLGYTQPDEPELSGLLPDPEPGEKPSPGNAYDILVADLYRELPRWE